ncbi:hypothetical protein SAMN02746089_02098 [Caldanaerobius fijiensis DSM 17918]|uniref:Uncharacterized protein n=1 Tax=Caldanaerobius fijiensis DSM 17918 TaxID=1121256 RepID=A0A1M5CDC2_9THEO|nr:hypothetical protein [Caldanaerobius fijiensis]SHF52666.1 hypothetical protein SAMN02746089_02098 [Caldanaerobius fijiensis DSM 17918]
MIKEQMGFVIKEGGNMFDKGFGSDIRFTFDVGFDKSLKSTLRSFLLEYEQRGIVDDIKEFFNWLLDNLKNDIKTIKENNYECLYDEYHRVEKLLKNKSDYISNYDYLNLLNYDSLQRLKKILLSYKEGYAVFQNYRKDINFYNDLLAWYEDIPEDLIMFIKNLYEKQFEDYLNAYILKDTVEMQ